MPFLFIFEAHTWRVMWFLAIQFFITNIIVIRSNYDSINDRARWPWTWSLK